MRPGQPSKTAFGAALLRAQHQDLDDASIFRDPLAAAILSGYDDAGLPVSGQASPARLRRHRCAAPHRPDTRPARTRTKRPPVASD